MQVRLSRPAFLGFDAVVSDRNRASASLSAQAAKTKPMPSFHFCSAANAVSLAQAGGSMRQGLIALSFSVAIDAAFLDAFCYIRLQEQDWLNVVQWLEWVKCATTGCFLWPSRLLSNKLTGCFLLPSRLLSKY